MSFVTTQPELLASAASQLHGFGEVMTAQNAAAAAPMRIQSSGRPVNSDTGTTSSAASYSWACEATCIIRPAGPTLLTSHLGGGINPFPVHQGPGERRAEP